MDLKKGFIISTNKYKDNDLIVNLLCEDEIISFKAISLNNMNKSLINDLQCLSFGEFELYKGGLKNYTLRNCKIFYSLYKEVFSSREYLFPYEYIKEVIKKVPPQDDLLKSFKLLDLTISHIIQHKEDILKILILFIAFYLRFSGFSISELIENRVFNILSKHYSSLNSQIEFKQLRDTFLNVYNSLFNKRYILAKQDILKVDDKYLLIVFNDLNEIFEQLNVITINSLNLF